VSVPMTLSDLQNFVADLHNYTLVRFDLHAHSMRNNNQILHGDQTMCAANFYAVDHECWRAMTRSPCS